MSWTIAIPIAAVLFLAIHSIINARKIQKIRSTMPECQQSTKTSTTKEALLLMTLFLLMHNIVARMTDARDIYTFQNYFGVDTIVVSIIFTLTVRVAMFISVKNDDDNNT